MLKGYKVASIDIRLYIVKKTYMTHNDNVTPQMAEPIFSAYYYVIFTIFLMFYLSEGYNSVEFASMSYHQLKTHMNIYNYQSDTLL